MTDTADGDALLFVKPVLSEVEAANRLVLRQVFPPFRKVRMEKVELTFLPHYMFMIKDQTVTEIRNRQRQGHTTNAGRKTNV